ncbi:condensin complex subunit 1-like isoform X1 [Paramuricea clavata]|uniref:Condensin complex subunit 1 n=1 Tax=Paramuricea clavata TaxID=317549 RepID=A0A6S7KHY5_PARCT|nr:condensin complex subunit 1-like isoform X1 [Paramuricea clavata]
MLSLVWSKDNDVKSKVVDAYTRLYLNPQVYKLMKTSLIPKNVIHLLWEKFAMKDPQTTQEQSKSALKLLGMLARGKHEIVKSNIEVLVSIGLGERAKDDALLVRDTCTILLTLNKNEEKVRDDKQGPLRFSSDHMAFQRLNDILVSSITSPVQGMWVPMAEEAINVVYNLAEHPDKICGHLIKNLIKKIFGEEENLDGSDANIDKAASEETPAPVSCPSYVLARFLAAAGHIALQQVVHLEASILGEIKRRERLKEDSKGEKKKNISTSTSVTQTPRTKEGASETLEDEMGLTGATAEDAEAEYIKKICDHEIVTGGNNLLSLLGSLIVAVCNNPAKYSDLQVQTAASLALSKFMLVSAEFCEKNLQLLFTILEKSRHEVIRSNTIISLGDLTPRFPNIIEPWTPNLYARLRDDSSQVRMNAMKIMTRLILNDMVKVKGQISEMATCLEDDDPRIAELAKSFFSELSKKGNAVYNILPDVISRLSDPDTGIEEAPFRNIMSYLFSFIQKDRQCESLVEKLCHRFRATRTDRQWIDLSFCLAQLSYNERSLRKLQENFACFQGTLSNDDVFGFFSTIMGKCKKMAKPEIKVVVEELELRITTCHEKGVEEEAGYERANQASAAARVLVGKVANTPANKKTRSTRGRTPASRRRRKNDSESEVVPKPQTGKKSTRKSRKKVIEFDSDDEEMMQGTWDEAFEAEKENVEV